MYVVRRFFKRCFPHRRHHSELSENETTAIKESWAKARHVEIGKRILYTLLDKKPKFAEYYGIEATLKDHELLANNAFLLQAQRIQNFLDTVVASLGFCSDEAVYCMARKIGQIHYFKGVNFGADLWLVFKKVTVDQIISHQRRRCARQFSTVSSIDSSLSMLDPGLMVNTKVCMATVGWNRLMGIIIREMKRGFLDEAQRSCQERSDGV